MSKKIITKENASEFMPWFADFVYRMLKSDKKIKLEFDEFKQNRSNAQNRLLWKWHSELKSHIANELGEVYDNKTIHEFIVSKIGNNEVREFKTVNGFGDVFVDQVIVREKTSKMKIKRFTEFLNHYEHYAREHYGIQFSHPEDLYYMAMGN